MRSGLQIGHTAHLTWQVDAGQIIHLGAESGAGAVVFSTPSMINLMEHAAREALRPFLEEGEESVGAEVQIQHLAATPVGSQVEGTARVTAVDGKLIDFEITARDEAEQIGRGTHRRAVIRMDRFGDRLHEKSQKLSSAMPLPQPVEPNPGDLPQLETISVEQQGAIATVSLNRPRKANAVNAQMTSDWEAVASWLAGHEREVRAVIVTGADDNFCAGDDIPEVGTLSMPAATELSLRQARLYLSFEQLPQPLIAAVGGFALGGGCVCAYSCDFRIASVGARFGMPETLLGWPPGYGVAQLTALIGKARALELCLTGKQITARQALEYGLVHEVVPPLRLMPAARELAAQLLAVPPRALAETKRLIHADEGVRPKLAHLADTAAYIRCLQTSDAREAIAAFVEKRKPRFGGE